MAFLTPAASAVSGAGLSAATPGAGIAITVANPLAPGGERGAGSGLVALRSRVELLGGVFGARASRGRFELRAELPWEVA